MNSTTYRAIHHFDYLFLTYFLRCQITITAHQVSRATQHTDSQVFIITRKDLWNSKWSAVAHCCNLLKNFSYVLFNSLCVVCDVMDVQIFYRSLNSFLHALQEYLKKITMILRFRKKKYLEHYTCQKLLDW